jgi:molybdate transport system ATP-binding protein
MCRLKFQCRHRFASGFVLDAEFAIGDGVTALFGPSGAGKSSTLAIIAGTLRPQQGLVQLNGRPLVDTTRGLILPAERRQIGCVFQDDLLFPHLTVEQNLRYALLRRPARQVDFQRVVETLELKPLLARRPGSLSGGEKQRTALGRALLRGPDLLLLDEPLTALDSELKGRIAGYLERVLSEWRVPTLLVSHDQADVRRLAEQVIVLEAGRVVGRGETSATLAPL